MNNPNTPVDLSGYFPVRISRLDQKLFAKFARLPLSAFDNPFMEPEPVVRLGEKHEYDTKGYLLDPLLDQIIRAPHIPVGGFIFHLSRCGSTLVSQMLKVFDDLLVISEPPGISNILFHSDMVPEQKALVVKRLKAVVLAHAHSMESRKRRLFIKLQEFPIFHLDLIREALPNVPWIFLYRAPVEIMASWFKDEKDRSPMLMRLHKNGHFDYLSRQLKLSPEEMAETPREEMAAILIGRMIQKAMSGLNQQGLAVDYASLPRSFFSHIARHFGLRVSGRQGLAVMEVSKYYSKAKQSRLFESDSLQKRESASPAIKAAAQKWAESYYHQLKSSQEAQEKHSA